MDSQQRRISTRQEQTIQRGTTPFRYNIFNAQAQGPSTISPGRDECRRETSRPSSSLANEARIGFIGRGKEEWCCHYGMGKALRWLRYTMMVEWVQLELLPHKSNKQTGGAEGEGEVILWKCENCRCVCTRAKEYHSHKIRTLMPAELSFISIVCPWVEEWVTERATAWHSSEGSQSTDDDDVEWINIIISTECQQRWKMLGKRKEPHCSAEAMRFPFLATLHKNQPNHRQLKWLLVVG